MSEFIPKECHQITRFQVSFSADGEVMGIEFWRPDGTSFVVVLPLGSLFKFREQVQWGFEQCAERANTKAIRAPAEANAPGVMPPGP